MNDNKLTLYDVLDKFLSYGIARQGISYDEKSYTLHQFKFSWKYVDLYPCMKYTCISACIEYQILDPMDNSDCFDLSNHTPLMSMSFILINGKITSYVFNYFPDTSKFMRYEKKNCSLSESFTLGDVKLLEQLSLPPDKKYDHMRDKIDMMFNDLKIIYHVLDEDNIKLVEKHPKQKKTIVKCVIKNKDSDNFRKCSNIINSGSYLLNKKHVDNRPNKTYISIKAINDLNLKYQMKQGLNDFSDIIRANVIKLCKSKYLMDDGRIFIPIGINSTNVNADDNGKNIDATINITMDGISCSFPMQMEDECVDTTLDISIPIKTLAPEDSSTLSDVNNYNEMVDKLNREDDESVPMTKFLNDEFTKDIHKFTLDILSFCGVVNHLWNADEFLEALNSIINGKRSLQTFDCSVASDNHIYVIANKKTGDWINCYKLKYLGQSFLTNMKSIKSLEKFIIAFRTEYEKENE